MELVEGDTLRGPLPLARQVAEALEAAHNNGIIHRNSIDGKAVKAPKYLAAI